jgi:hypothetical protein
VAGVVVSSIDGSVALLAGASVDACVGSWVGFSEVFVPESQPQSSKHSANPTSKVRFIV